MKPQDCTICCAASQMRCPNFHFASSCSIACATTDEYFHNQFCAIYKTFLSTPRPTTSHRIGILFPATGPPKFIWATCKPVPYSNMGAGKKSPARFTGPLTVLAFDRAGSVTEVRIPRDITLEDVRLAIDYFAHGDEPLHGQWLSLWNQCGRTGQVLGVKIHCDAELKEEKFQAVNVPKNHPVFENCSTPISIAMNLPLKMWIYPHINVGGGSAYLNVEASSMNRITNVTDKRWGEVPEEWKCEVGSVLVVRQDGKNLKAGEVKALATFCTDVLDVLISQTKSGVGYSRECLVQEFMDRNTFELWLSARNVSMKRGGVDEGMMNPYDGLGADEGRVEDMEMTDVLMLDTAARSSDFLKVIRRGTAPMSRNFAFQKLVLRRGLSGVIR